MSGPYHNTVNMDLLDFLSAHLQYDDVKIKERIRSMSFSEYLEMMNAYHENDPSNLYTLFSSIDEADNAYGGSSSAANTSAVGASASATTANSSVKNIVLDPNNPKYNPELDPTNAKFNGKKLQQYKSSTSTDTKNLAKHLGSLKTDSEYEESVDYKDTQRLKELSGIEEDDVDETCSGGATGAGAVASAPVAVGKARKRKNPSIYKR